MTDESPSDPIIPDNAKPSEEPSSVEEETVDLSKAAGEAAATQAADDGRKIRSLDDLDLKNEVRKQIDSYVSKAVNDAVSKHDRRSQEKLDEDGYLNRTQIESLLTAKEDEYTQRDAAKERFLNVLGEEGIQVGTDEYRSVQSFYKKSLESKVFTSHILLTAEGIRTLVAMSGAKPAGPQSPMGKNLPPEGSITWVDGTTQLNAKQPGEPTLDEKMRAAIQASLEVQE